MNLTERTQELKSRVTNSLRQWANSRIDQFMRDNPMLAPAGKYLKRGISNLITREDERIGRGIDHLMLFIADPQGNYDMNMLFGDALDLFKSMPETSFDMGLLRGTVGKGTLRILLPDHPLVSLFMGNTGALQVTEEDFKELKEILCSGKGA